MTSSRYTAPIGLIYVALCFLVSLIGAGGARARALSDDEIATLRAWNRGFEKDLAARRLAAQLGAELDLDAEQVLLDTQNEHGLEAFVGNLAAGRELTAIDCDALSKRILQPSMPAQLKGRVQILLARQIANVQRAQQYTTENLIWWISQNRLDLVATFLAHEVDLNGRDSRGITPLYAALSKGDRDIARQLIERGADVTLPSGPMRLSSLFAACAADPSTEPHASADMVSTLLSHGASIKSADILGRSTVHYAALSGNADCLARVVTAGGRVDQRTASKKSLHTDDPTTLLYAGATPLHYAVESRNVDAAGYLVTHGAKVDAKTDAGMTPLFAALLHHASPAMVELLLRHGADVNASVDGVNPRLIAHLRSESEIERLLASAGGTYRALNLGEAKIQTWMRGSAP